ncbi:MAG: hypothetical protein E8D44_00120 [Nitrospira sp.]|nr:MAG: hypothetical protein E8D44_00120 [Nitrospira sp.]
MTSQSMAGSKARWRATRVTGEIMKNTAQTFVLTMNSPSRKGMRVWTGKNIHALRHCSVKQIGQALIELQHHMNQLQAAAPAPGRSDFLNRSR